MVPDADLRVLGSQIKYRGLSIQSIDIDGNLLQRKLDLPSCKVVFNKDNFIDAKGNALLDDPYDYDADATVQFQDLGFLNELTKSFGQDLGLAGKLSANWKGNGPLKEQVGGLELHGDQLRTKTIQNIKLDATGHYEKFNAEVPRLQISSPYADLDASIRFNPQLFEIPELKIRRSGNTVSGNIKIPLDLHSGRKVPLDLDQPVEINIQGDNISLASFQSGKPQVTGTLGFRLQASQTLRDPLIQFTASARDIRTTSVSNLSAASGDFSIRIADKILTVDGKIQQSDIHPLVLTGRMPLDVGQIIQVGSVPDDTPLQFSLKWPDNNSGVRSQNRPGHQGRRRNSERRCECQRDSQTAGPGRKYPRDSFEVSGQDRYGPADFQLYYQYNVPARSHPNRPTEGVGRRRPFWSHGRNRPEGRHQSDI